MAPLTTQSYKGARDFYPEDMRLQRYIFDVWRLVNERFGYEEYSAPLIEPTGLYLAKTGEEIVSEQTYSFTDRGGRDVTIRPEMTPSLARMVAARHQELSYPLRWYSIPNLWRYERPQHGRLREHWQLNTDIFGIEDISAELEIIRLGTDLLLEFGADTSMFIVRLNHRELMSYLFGEYLGLSVDAAHRMSKLLDRRDKMPEKTFTSQAGTILGDKLRSFLELLTTTRLQDLPGELRESAPADELKSLAVKLHKHGVDNIRFDLTLQRGFDYYTGIVFEFFDTNPENSRSLFGGGRYDDLLQIFQSPRIPAVGMGTGDVTLSDFLRTHSLLPRLVSSTRVCVATVSSDTTLAESLSGRLRKERINVFVDTTDRKLGTKIKAAAKKSIPYLIVVGDSESKSGQYTLRDLSDGNERTGSVKDIIAWLN